MSSDGRRPSRQRIGGLPVGPQPSRGPDTNYDTGAYGAPPSGAQQLPLAPAPQTVPAAAPSGLYGLAADLAGVQAPQQGADPSAGIPQASRPPARLGSARSGNTTAVPLLPLRPTSAAAATAASSSAFRAANPFTASQPQPQLPPQRHGQHPHPQQLLQQQPYQQPPTAAAPGGGEVPYGLAVDLLHNNDPAAALGFAPIPSATAASQAPPPFPDTGTGLPNRRGERLARRALAPQLSDAAQSRQGRLGRSAPPAAAEPPQQPRAAAAAAGPAIVVAAAPTPMQPPPLDPLTVMELATSQPGLPEPDYGIVAELRNRTPPDPFAADFGMAAEVARRRSRSPSPLGRGGGLGEGLGAVAGGGGVAGGDGSSMRPLRARRRLDPVGMSPGGGEGFGLDGDIAARQRQTAADRAEPFAAAARTAVVGNGGGEGEGGAFFGGGGLGDPFALADEQIKIPRELLQQPPYEPSQQELPGPAVPLKAGAAAPHDATGSGGGSDAARPEATNSSGGDGAVAAEADADRQPYGIASELGVDPLTGMRQELLGRDALGLPPLPSYASQQAGLQGQPAGLPGQPGVGQGQGQAPEPPEQPGHKYMYDEDTGMLVTTAGGQGDGGRVVRQYIEDEVTGVFYQLLSKRRRLFGLLRRKEPAVMEEDDEEEVRGFRGRLRSTLLGITNFFNVLGMFAEGLVAGFALLNFFMTYMLYGSTSLREFLRYYGPLAQSNNRLYYSLLVLAVISSTCRLARDRLRGFQPRHLQLAAVDYGQLLLYVAAYITSILCTPLDDELTYEAKRNPRFYQLSFASGFKRRLALWHALNILRTLFTGLAWVLACYQTSPYVFDATLRAELKALRRQQEMLMGSRGPGARGAAGAAAGSGANHGRSPRKGAGGNT
ncbi:hypothetical protein Agub_g13530 [Astrephomene gubernaculifera]|uniref:Uncharacterized protein n=1 Tax=Astrephomene gubernaculifera TaxID=47775 RepID=A0AAD3HSF6_9CHLO|nr:hypothetical protein Agub_g13530 [Astrephomene gubernaculifera]